jgi:outer membrane protein assembly factor BamB
MTMATHLFLLCGIGSLVASSPVNGTVAWHKAADLCYEPPSFYFTSGAHGMVWDGGPKSGGIFLILGSNQSLNGVEATTGNIKWSRPLDGRAVEVEGVFITKSGLAVVVSYDVIAEKGSVEAIHPMTGARQWITPIDPGSLPISASDGNLVLATGSKTTVAIDAGSGSIKWSHLMAKSLWSQAVALGDGHAMVMSTNNDHTSGDITCYDMETGQQKWRVATPSNSIFTKAIVASGAKVVVLASGWYKDFKLHGLALNSGEERWSYPPPVHSGNFQAIPCNSNQVFIGGPIDAGTGKSAGNCTSVCNCCSAPPGDPRYAPSYSTRNRELVASDCYYTTETPLWQAGPLDVASYDGITQISSVRAGDPAILITSLYHSPQRTHGACINGKTAIAAVVGPRHFPPPPTAAATCKAELLKVCPEEVKQGQAVCALCAGKHEDALDKAGCTDQLILQDCQGTYRFIV